MPVLNPWAVAVEATGANKVTPNAKKKNQSGVLTNSPTIHAGYRKYDRRSFRNEALNSAIKREE
jgi:hypothetical protein